ncbi:LysR family transcriptional regulator [uncultured Cohaesibacter sp.]|uniref:LysR family transcriptional regulator n=1 Tax=uncultured Cohaesibacter sp. TaxID=1002546 RepID=UPI0029C87F00|nr:LysR family transcriptional regulator [uncultured Cohaesibacter sp.]
MVAPNFNLRHLRAFCLVARTGSVSKAADQIHLSQPAVSQAIRKLEAQLDEPLFDRQSSGLTLTEVGKLTEKRALNAFSLLEEGITIAGRRAQRPNARKAIHLVSSTHLRALVALQSSGSFALAARRIGTSQSSLHRTARDLEKLLNIPFFASTHRGIELTDAAALFARHVRLADAELRQAYYEVTHFKGEDCTRIAVGTMPLSRTMIVPDAIEALFRENKGVRVSNIDGPYNELLRRLRYGELDFLIGATRNPPPTSDIEQEVLFADQLSVIAGPRHPLVGRNSLSVEDIKTFPWISPPYDTPTGRQIGRLLACQQGELYPGPVRVVSSSLVMIRGLLQRGDYVTLMSPNQMRVELDLGLVVKLGLELPDTERSIGLTYRKGWHPTKTQSRFMDLVRCAAADGHSLGS